MLKLQVTLIPKNWLLILTILAVTALPLMAGSNDANPANSSSTSASSAPASATPDPNPNPSPSPSVGLATTTGDANVAALLGVLVKKGVLAPAEANAIRSALPSAQFQALVETLSRKGVLNAADLAVAAPASQPSAVVAASDAASEAVSSSRPEPAAQAGAGAPMAPPTPPPPAVIPAVAPLRVVAADPPKKDGLNAAFKMGPVKMTPYGFIKTTIVQDSSDPDGDDFPFIGLFLNTNPSSILSTGPTKDPEFHIKARSTRIGANFEWPDVSPKLTFTGRIEADFEAMFTTVDNADISSIRNPTPRMRLAYVRMDYAANDSTDIFFQGGQDWSLYASTALPNLLETTFLGAFYGSSYTRSPQFELGMVNKLGGTFKLLPTVALMMPSTGQLDKLCGGLGLPGSGGNGTCLFGYEDQLGQGEREGADADRPEYEARVALQWQLDPARGVAPAQIFWSGFRSRRTSIVPTSSYLCSESNPLACSLEAAFPNGFQASSKQYGNQLAIQLPTRYFTLVASGYRGGDLRFFAAGQVSAFFTDIAGLSGVTSYAPQDGVVFATGSTSLACNVALVDGVCPSTSNVVVAPQRPIRAFGGFINLGLPLSRWFNADPKGRNAGWQLFLHVGKDQVVNRDVNQPDGPIPLLMGKVAAATLYYKVNPWCTFGVEQSVYATRLIDHLDLYNIAGVLGNEWQDHRTEFGPIFTF